MLKSKVVIVTGGSGLLGQAFVEAIAQNGGIAVIADIENKDIQDSIKAKGYTGSALFQYLDITEEGSIQELIDNLVISYGKVDAIVNNAYPRNVHYGREWMDVDYDDFCENTNLNLGGYFLVSQVIAKYFLKQGYGNIINIASIYGVVAPRFEIYENAGFTMPVEYAVIKSGVIHLTKYFAKALKGKNIRVNSLSPGGIIDSQPSEFVDAYKNYCLNKGMLDKNDLTGTLVYLLSDVSKCVNGQNIIVDDGFSL